MKVLVFSDLHLHVWNYGSTLVNGMNSRLLAQAKVLDQIAQYTYDNEVDHIVFCGDLFHCHGKIDAAVLKVAYEGITKIMEIVDGNYSMNMLVGNHDTDRKDLSVHALHWLESIPFVRVIDKPTHNDGISYAPRGFSYLPYTEDAEVIKKFLADAGEFCFMHQGVAGVPMASGFVINETLSADMIPDHVRHVFTGHYHQHNRVSDKLTVVGSTMQHTWADVGDTRGFLVVDTDTLEINQVGTAAPSFRILNMCGTALIGSNVSIEKVVSGSFVRVTNFQESFIENLRKELFQAGALFVEFVIEPKKYNSTAVKAISGDGLSMPQLVSEYEKAHNVSGERSNIGKELMK